MNGDYEPTRLELDMAEMERKWKGYIAHKPIWEILEVVFDEFSIEEILDGLEREIIEQTTQAGRRGQHNIAMIFRVFGKGVQRIREEIERLYDGLSGD